MEEGQREPRRTPRLCIFAKEICVKFLPRLKPYKLCAHLPLCLVRAHRQHPHAFSLRRSHTVLCTQSQHMTPPSTQIDLEHNSVHVHLQLCIHGSAFTALHSQLCSEDRLRRQHRLVTVHREVAHLACAGHREGVRVRPKPKRSLALAPSQA